MKKKMRECLGCGKPFWSQHVHNRLCSNCREANSQVVDYHISDLRNTGRVGRKSASQ